MMELPVVSFCEVCDLDGSRNGGIFDAASGSEASSKYLCSYTHIYSGVARLSGCHRCQTISKCQRSSICRREATLLNGHSRSRQASPALRERPANEHCERQSATTQTSSKRRSERKSGQEEVPQPNDNDERRERAHPSQGASRRRSEREEQAMRFPWQMTATAQLESQDIWGGFREREREDPRTTRRRKV